jgi:hypothetical protein
MNRSESGGEGIGYNGMAKSEGIPPANIVQPTYQSLQWVPLFSPRAFTDGV